MRAFLQRNVKEHAVHGVTGHRAALHDGVVLLHPANLCCAAHPAAQSQHPFVRVLCGRFSADRSALTHRSRCSYVILSGLGGGLLILSLVTYVCAVMSRRPATRNKSVPLDQEFAGKGFIKFDNLAAPHALDLSGGGGPPSPAASPIPTPPSMGVVFQDVCYDVEIAATYAWWQWLWCPWWWSCCSRSATKRRVLHGVAGAIRPGELYVLRAAACAPGGEGG